MRPKFVVVTLLAALLSSYVSADVCPLPADPQIPDGKQASAADMLKGKQAMEAYKADVARYLECDSTPIKKKRAEQKAQAIMVLFEEQMKVYSEKF